MSATSTAKKGFQSFLWYEDPSNPGLPFVSPNSPGSFIKLVNITDLAPSGIKNDLQDTTQMDSPGGMKEFLATLGDAGSVVGTFSWDPTNPGHQQLFTDAHLRTARNYLVTWSNAISYWGFNGTVEQFTPSAKPGSPLDTKVTVKINGDFTTLA